MFNAVNWPIYSSGFFRYKVTSYECHFKELSTTQLKSVNHVIEKVKRKDTKCKKNTWEKRKDIAVKTLKQQEE